MKQLIPQQRIDETAKKSSLKTVSDLPTRDMRSEMSSTEWQGWFKDEFDAGVQFALKEIEPLMVEFAEWCSGRWLKYELIELGVIWLSKEDYITTTNSQQLLEEFINSKNK